MLKLYKKIAVWFVRLYLSASPITFGKRFIIEKGRMIIPNGQEKLKMNINGFNINFILNMPEDYFYSDLYFTNRIEEGTSIFFRSFLNESDVVFDIGTNLGFMTLQYACICSNGKVYSFEPMPKTFERLRMNVDLNHDVLSRIQLINMAVCDSDGELTLFSPNDGHHGLVSISSQVSEQVMPSRVKACTIDTFVADNSIMKIDFMKIDVEGAEMLVFKGAMKTIEKFRPSVMLEANISMHKDKSELISILDHICNLGDYYLFRSPSAYKDVVKMINTTDFNNGDNVFLLNTVHWEKMKYSL